MLVDVIISFNLAVKIKSVLKGVREAIRYDDIKAKIKEDRKNLKKRASFLFAFRGEKPVTEYVKEMLLGKLKKVSAPAVATKNADNVGENVSAIATADNAEEKSTNETNDKSSENK